MQNNKEIPVPLEHWFKPDAGLALPVGICRGPEGQWVAFNLARNEYMVLSPDGEWVPVNFTADEIRAALPFRKEARVEL